MDSEERLLRAFDLEEPDRVPLFELGINPHPLLKLLIFWKNIPRKLKKIIKNSGYYYEYIDVVRENLGMGSNYRSLFRKPLMMKPAARFLFSIPVNWKQNYQKLLMYYLPIKLLTQYDGIGFPVFPSTKIIGKKDGLMVLESGMSVDIDPKTANIRWRSIAFPPNKDESISYKQLKYILNIIDVNNFDWEFSIKSYQKIKWINICKPLTCLGFWEIWDSLYGVPYLSKFYYQISSEFRKKSGPILDLWNKLEKFFIEVIDRFSEIGAKIIGLLDDLVYDEGPFVNPKYYRKFLFPHYKKVIDHAHRRGMRIFLHTDGKLDSIIHDLISLGFDGLQSIQADVNNFREIKEKFGDKICLIGGISSKRLEQANANKIYSETKYKVSIGKVNGGYIAGSDNMIHDGVKIENLFAMLKAVKKYGKYR
ncbi:MAG: uroporphyrinogen decarboxylase family protein [Candidatus Helarchaeota archaeon]